jgi:TonB family protein
VIKKAQGGFYIFLFFLLSNGLYASSDIVPPRLIKYFPADYPAEALAAKIQGEVELILEVDEEGKVVNVVVSKGLGYGLDEAAKKAAFQFQFIPAKIKGKPVRAQIKYRYRFVLPKEKEKLEPPKEHPPALLERKPPSKDLPVYRTVIRKRAFPESITIYKLSGEEASRIPGTLGDPFRAIQSLPGVARARYLGGELIVRGAAPLDSGVLLDGHPIPQLYHFMNGPAVINSAFLKDIEFLPGAWDIKYGRFIGGILDAHTRPARQKKWYFQSEMDIIDLGIGISGPITQKHAITISARRSILGDLLPYLTNQTTTPRYYDFQGRYDLYLKKQNQISLIAFGSDDKVVFPVPKQYYTIAGEGGEEMFNQNLFIRILPKWIYKGGSSKIKTSLCLGRDQIIIKTAQDRLNYKVTIVEVRKELEYKLGPSLSALFGIDVQNRFFDFAYRLPGPSPIISRFPKPRSETYFVENIGEANIFVFGVYLGALSQLGRLKVKPGFRIDAYQFPAHSPIGLDPRIRGEFELLSNLFLKAGLGLYHQPPQPRDLSGDFGNPMLELERASHHTFGFEYKPLPNLEIGIEGFFNDRWHLVAGSGRIIRRDKKIKLENLTNRGQGRAYGMETLIKYNSKKDLQGWISYTLSKSEERGSSRGKYLPSRFDQTHILNLVLEYKFKWDIKAGIRFRFVTGNPRTPIKSGIYDADVDRFYGIWGEYASVRMPAFHQLDLRIEKSFWVKGFKIKTYLEVLNVYNRRNPEFFTYNFDYTQSGPVTGMPIVPSIGVFIER